jgi:hypothetical protein
MTADGTHFILKPRRACYIRFFRHLRATDLAKAKRILKWQRDPEGMRLRILEAAKQEFAGHGLAGARVDRIAAKAGANKRMLYYHAARRTICILRCWKAPMRRYASRSAGSIWNISIRRTRSSG